MFKVKAFEIWNLNKTYKHSVLLLWLALTRWPSHTNLTCIPWRHTCIPKLNFLGQCFRNLHTYIQTDRQTDSPKTIATAAFAVGNKLLTRLQNLKCAKMRLRCGPRWGSLNCFSDPLVGLKGRFAAIGGERGRRKKEGKRGSEREGKGCAVVRIM